MPVEIYEMVPVDFSRPWKGACRGWGAGNPACRSNWFCELAVGGMAMPCAVHTHARTAEDWPNPCLPGQGKSAGSEELGSKYLLLDYRSVGTKLRLPKDCRIQRVLLLPSFLSLDSQGSEPVTSGLVCWLGSPSRVPLFPFCASSPIICWGLTSGLLPVWKHWKALNDSSMTKTL